MKQYKSGRDVYHEEFGFGTIIIGYEGITDIKYPIVVSFPGIGSIPFDNEGYTYGDEYNKLQLLKLNDIKYQVGQQVVNIDHGIGIISEVDFMSKYPLSVRFSNGAEISFTADGYQFYKDTSEIKKLRIIEESQPIYKLGDKVQHPKYGAGFIENIFEDKLGETCIVVKYNYVAMLKPIVLYISRLCGGTILAIIKLKGSDHEFIEGTDQ